MKKLLIISALALSTSLPVLSTPSYPLEEVTHTKALREIKKLKTELEALQTENAQYRAQIDELKSECDTFQNGIEALELTSEAWSKCFEPHLALIARRALNKELEQTITRCVKQYQKPILDEMASEYFEELESNQPNFISDTHKLPSKARFAQYANYKNNER